jgi:hypothetical protein
MGIILAFLIAAAIYGAKRTHDWSKKPRPPHDEPDRQTKYTDPVVSDWE